MHNFYNIFRSLNLHMVTFQLHSVNKIVFGPVFLYILVLFVYIFLNLIPPTPLWSSVIIRQTLPLVIICDHLALFVYIFAIWSPPPLWSSVIIRHTLPLVIIWLPPPPLHHAILVQKRNWNIIWEREVEGGAESQKSL